MNNGNRKTKRTLLAACLALLLALPFSVVPNMEGAPTAVAHTGGFEFRRVPEAKPDTESAGAACAGRASLKPGERLTGGRGSDWHASPKALPVGPAAFQQTTCRFVCGDRKQFSLTASSQAAHGCRAPPFFSSKI